MSEGALHGIRILDLSRVLAGPYCTMLMGDYGAEVIKVEIPGRGDDTRHWGPPWAGGESAYYLSTNRNKYSITLNLKHPEGQKTIKDLAKISDIVVENFKIGTMKRLGLDYESLKIVNPRLIFCSISGYGQAGPDSHRPGYDFVTQAEGGIMSITGPKEGPPYKVGVAIADIVTGLFAASAILAALHHREKTGEGQYIDVALMDAQVAWLANVAQNYLVSGEMPQRYGNAHPNIVPYEVFPTEDGYVAVGIGNDAQYQRFCDVADCPELWQEPKYQTNASRVEHRDELIPQLQSVFRKQSTSWWLDLLRQEKISAGSINNIQQVLTDPQVLSRQMVQSITHPTAGEVKLLGPVAKFSHTPAKIQSHPPLLGEHTRVVLGDLLGRSPEEIQRMEQDSVI